MLEFFRQNQFLVGALSGSLAAYLLGLLISHLRREKRWLGFNVSNRNVVQRGHTKVSMRYEDREIERIDSHATILRNIGNRPLTNLPVSLNLEGEGAILEFEVKVPDGSRTTATLENPTKLVVNLDLLNPGETVEVGLTVADGNESQVKVVARAELLELKELHSTPDPLELFEAMVPFSPLLGGLNLRMYRLLRRLNGK